MSELFILSWPLAGRDTHYTPLALIKPPPHLVHFPQERPVARAVDRSEVVNVPPEVVVRRKSRRSELRFERRIAELETREPVGNNEIKLLEKKQIKSSSKK